MVWCLMTSTMYPSGIKNLWVWLFLPSLCSLMLITVIYRSPPHPLTFLFLQDSVQSTLSLKCFLSFPGLQTDVIVLSSQDTLSIPLLQQLPLCIVLVHFIGFCLHQEFLEGMDWVIFKFVVCACHGMDNKCLQGGPMMWDRWRTCEGNCLTGSWSLRPVQTWVETLSSQKWLIVCTKGSVIWAG